MPYSFVNLMSYGMREVDEMTETTGFHYLQGSIISVANLQDGEVSKRAGLPHGCSTPSRSSSRHSIKSCRAGHRPFDGYGRTVDGRIRLRLSRPPSVNLLPRTTDSDGTVTVQL